MRHKIKWGFIKILIFRNVGLQYCWNNLCCGQTSLRFYNEYEWIRKLSCILINFVIYIHDMGHGRHQSDICSTFLTQRHAFCCVCNILSNCRLRHVGYIKFFQKEIFWVKYCTYKFCCLTFSKLRYRYRSKLNAPRRVCCTTSLD